MDIGNSFERAFDEVATFLPNLIAALVIALVAWILAVVLGKVVAKVAQRVGADRLPEREDGGWMRRITTQPSSLLGTITFWVIFLGGLSLALAQLQIQALDGFLAAVWAYVPHLLAAFAIFVIAAFVATAVSRLARTALGDSPLGRIAGTAAPILVMTIATFMILVELQLGQTIVMITFAGLMAAFALGTGLAFGLGGRAVAHEMLRGAYEKGQEHKDEFKRDLDGGLERGRPERDDEATEPRYAVTRTPATPPER